MEQLFRCVDCTRHRCEGIARCRWCGTGPLCSDCAVDHMYEHENKKEKEVNQ